MFLERQGGSSLPDDAAGGGMAAGKFLVVNRSGR